MIQCENDDDLNGNDNNNIAEDDDDPDDALNIETLHMIRHRNQS